MGGAGGRGGVKEQLPSEFESESSSLSPIPTSLICSSSDSIDERASSSPSTGPRTSSTSSFSPASTNAELVCDYSDCGRIFSKRHDLNRHKRYHTKTYQCQMTSCKARGVGIFALKKDLLRHESMHSGHRYFCPLVGCASAAGGSFGGFSRKDNWKRHLNTQHAGGNVVGYER